VNVKKPESYPMTLDRLVNEGTGLRNTAVVSESRGRTEINEKRHDNEYHGQVVLATDGV
jgi:hypothetical protein